jgi:hypothetical protein
MTADDRPLRVVRVTDNAKAQGGRDILSVMRLALATLMLVACTTQPATSQPSPPSSPAPVLVERPDPPPVPHDPPRFLDVSSDSQTLLTGAAFAPDGALYVAGTFFGKLALGGAHLTARRGDWLDGFVARIGRDGKVAWVVPFAAGDEVSAVAATPDGGVVVAGNSTYIVGKDRGPTEDLRARAAYARYDATGAVRWKQVFGSDHRAFADGVAVAGDGTVFGCGAFEGTTAFGATKLTSTQGRYVPSLDTYVVRLAAGDGAVGWVATGGGVQDDVAQGVAVLASGSIAVAGYVGPQPRFGDVELAGAPSGQRLANPTRGFVAIYGAATGALRRVLQLGSADSFMVTGVAAIGDVAVVRGWDEDITTNARPGFVARVSADGVASRGVDTTGAAVVGDALVSARVANHALVFERVQATDTTVLATVPHRTPAKLEIVALAAASDGRFALIGALGDNTERPQPDGSIEVDMSTVHGFVAIVSELRDVAQLAPLQ